MKFEIKHIIACSCVRVRAEQFYGIVMKCLISRTDLTQWIETMNDLMDLLVR